MNNNFYGGGSTIPNLGTGSRTYYPSPVTTSPTNNIIWVQGIEGAKAYQLSPNSMAILLNLVENLYEFGQKLLIVIF